MCGPRYADNVEKVRRMNAARAAEQRRSKGMVMHTLAPTPAPVAAKTAANSSRRRETSDPAPAPPPAGGADGAGGGVGGAAAAVGLVGGGGAMGMIAATPEEDEGDGDGWGPMASIASVGRRLSASVTDAASGLY